MSALITDDSTLYACASCARCCTAPWAILMPEQEQQAIAALPLQETGRDPDQVFERAGKGLWALKKADSGACVFLDEDKLCAIHRRWGEAAKPTVCQRFPYLHVASDEHVWVTANYGCKAVQELRGPSLSTQGEALGRLFAKDIGEADPSADTVYPITSELTLSTAELDQAIDALSQAMGPRLFPALRQLAAFVGAAPEPGQAEAARQLTPEQVPGPVRYAFALTLYADLVDQQRFLDRLRGVVMLPKVLGFNLTYKSRFLGSTISMRAIHAHPGQLPPASEGLLLQWLRSRLRSRLVFKDAPHAAAGVTRLLLHADAVLYYARAQAGSAAITHQQVLRALEIVELLIANQAVLATLTRLDPRLRRFWQDPSVARGAAQLFTPAES